MHEPNFTDDGDSTADESRSAVSYLPRRGGELSSNQARYLVSHGSLPPVKRKECPVCLRRFIPPRGGRGNCPLNSTVYCSVACKKKSQILRREWYKAQSSLGERNQARRERPVNSAGSHSWPSGAIPSTVWPPQGTCLSAKEEGDR